MFRVFFCFDEPYKFLLFYFVNGAKIPKFRIFGKYIEFIFSSNFVTRIILRPLSALSLDDQRERNITTGLFGLPILLSFFFFFALIVLVASVSICRQISPPSQPNFKI